MPRLLLMILVFSLLALGYTQITKEPRSLEEDKSWATLGDY